MRADSPRGDGIAVMTNSGAMKSLVSESAARANIRLATFSADTQARLTEALGPEAAPGNPVDTRQTIRSENYAACLDALADEPDVGLILLAEELPLVPGIERKEANLRGVAEWTRARADRPPVALFQPVNVSLTEHARGLRAGLLQLPYFAEPDRTFRVIARLMAAGRRAALAQQARDKTDPAAARAVAALAENPGAEPRPLSEVESKALLGHFGIKVPIEKIAPDAEAAARAAAEIGFPVVIKALSAALPHKTEAGAIMLGLRDADAVRSACARIAANVEAYAPGTRLDGFLVAEQVTDGVELALGLTVDPEMGPVVMFGAGGVMLELHKDVAFGRPGLNAAEADAMIRATRANALIEGWRGAPALDRDAVIGGHRRHGTARADRRRHARRRGRESAGGAPRWPGHGGPRRPRGIGGKRENRGLGPLPAPLPYTNRRPAGGPPNVAAHRAEG